MLLGHLGMAYEGMPHTIHDWRDHTRQYGLADILLFFVVIVGGCFQTNISSVGSSTKQDKRRDSGFTLFYMGINLGSFWLR
jgi:POT family proton-dependent oligopeptide transporter